MAPVLKVVDLAVSIDQVEILKRVSLELAKGQVCALMGPNGSGKSSLAMAIMGHPGYRVSGGKIELLGTEITPMKTDERARAGIFVAWQTPMSITGVSVFSLCKTAYESQGKKIESIVEFKRTIEALLLKVGLAKDYLGRGVNEGFSGGEKKRLELLQLLLLQPKLAILDEIDSGMDIDALKLVGEVVAEMKKNGTTFLLITHYKRLLDFAHPDTIHVLREGKIVRSGGSEIVEEIEERGYKDPENEN